MWCLECSGEEMSWCPPCLLTLPVLPDPAVLQLRTDRGWRLSASPRSFPSTVPSEAFSLLAVPQTGPCLLKCPDLAQRCSLFGKVASALHARASSQVCVPAAAETAAACERSLRFVGRRFSESPTPPAD